MTVSVRIQRREVPQLLLASVVHGAGSAAKARLPAPGPKPLAAAKLAHTESGPHPPTPTTKPRGPPRRGSRVSSPRVAAISKPTNIRTPQSMPSRMPVAPFSELDGLNADNETW